MTDELNPSNTTDTGEEKPLIAPPTVAPAAPISHNPAVIPLAAAPQLIHSAPYRVLSKITSAMGSPAAVGAAKGLQNILMGAEEGLRPGLIAGEVKRAEAPSKIDQQTSTANLNRAKVPLVGAQTTTEQAKPALIGSETALNTSKEATEDLKPALVTAQTTTEQGKPAVQESVIEKNTAEANKAAKGGAPTLGKIDYGAGHVPTAVYDAQGNRHAVDEPNLDPTLAAFVKTSNDAYTKATEDQKIRTGIAQDKQRVDLGNKVDSVNAAVGAFKQYKQDFDTNAKTLSPKELSAMAVLISPEKVERSFIDKGISGVLDAVAGQPLTGYSPKVFEGLMTRDQYDALSPQSKQVLTSYFNAIIEHFNTLKNSQGSIPRNPQLIQAELHAIPLPYVDQKAGDDAFDHYFTRLNAHNHHLEAYGYKPYSKEEAPTAAAAPAAAPVKGKLSFKDFLAGQAK